MDKIKSNENDDLMKSHLISMQDNLVNRERFLQLYKLATELSIRMDFICEKLGVTQEEVDVYKKNEHNSSVIQNLANLEKQLAEDIEKYNQLVKEYQAQL